MLYLCNLLYSLWCCSRLSNLYLRTNICGGFIPFFLFFIPLWLVWLLICGGQYDVGTDYFTYYEIFENVDSEYFYRKFEWLFALTIDVFRGIGIPPQGLFFIFYLINFYFFCKILYLLKDIRTSFLFILLYICLSTVFNNQLNGLRQSTAIYIFTYATVSFNVYKSYWRYILLVLIAAGFHMSAYIFLPFCLVFKIKKLNKLMCLIIICLGAIFSVIGSYDWILDLSSSYLPAFYTPYIEGDLNTSNSVLNLITKWIFIPLYFLSITVLSKDISDEDRFLFIVGIIAYSIRLFFLENFIFNRIGQSFLLISVFPIYVYMKYLYYHKKRLFCYFICFMFLLFYSAKTVLFPKGEYLYQSIYGL